MINGRSKKHIIQDIVDKQKIDVAVISFFHKYIIMSIELTIPQIFKFVMNAFNVNGEGGILYISNA